MYTIHILSKSDAPHRRTAVVARQAGGCTAAEAPRENARMARVAAARQHGGKPYEWRVIRFAGAWVSEVAAAAVCDHLNQDPSLNQEHADHDDGTGLTGLDRTATPSAELMPLENLHGLTP